ncbi:hypothetical protein CAEBREN_19544 [Caenorhabditis brenneri]|uniref:Uncharacterized protein n=1 Tax=Caenorhabditis brenneri TaxID=135651 RepID=G0PMX5_CAEBE|nr:hypothetical protein CAEBREN_19544 [Caenorhabditis brenneri]
MSWIIHPAEVEPAENLIDLPEMTAATLPNFIGEDDNSAESKRKTMEFLARNNSFFEGMHVSVHKVLKLAANWVSNPGIPIRTVAVDEGLSAEFIGDLHQWFRELTEQWWEEKSLQGDWQLGGEGEEYKVQF